MIANFTEIGDIIKGMFAVAMYHHRWFLDLVTTKFVLGLVRLIVESGVRVKVRS